MPTQTPFPKVPVVGYVGGSNYDGTFRWDDWGRLCHYDALVVGFANYWNEQSSCHGPTEAGLDAVPQLNTNACIQRGPAWLGAPSEWSGCSLTQCGGCGDGTVGEQILSYQRKGRRVLLSVGGANADATNMNAVKGVALADSLWNMYLGGADARYHNWRPFGPQVVLDGIDIDLEQTAAGCPTSAACTEVMEGWYFFLKRIRALMDADSRKEYLITAVPINTKFADPAAGGYPSWGAYTHGYLPGIDNCPADFLACSTDGCPAGSSADVALRAQPSQSIFMAMHLIDFLWPQYYPSPVEITMNGDCWTNDLLAWTQIAIHAAKVSGEPNRCRVGVGVPFGAGAANGGQIGAVDAVTKISAALGTHPVLTRTFGGMFGWVSAPDLEPTTGCAAAPSSPYRPSASRCLTSLLLAPTVGRTSTGTTAPLPAVPLRMRASSPSF